MPLTTNFSVSPYFDDYDSDKNYYKVLFKPSTAVQVREMNQLQTMLQNQIEEFGDNILKAGTILSGCQFTFKDEMPYIKVLDRSSTGGAVDVNDYIGLFARGQSTGITARVARGTAGFQGDGVNLNSLYLEYQDNGTDDQYSKFAEGESVKIFSNQDIVYDINVVPGGASAGFSNADIVYVVSALKIANVVSGNTTDIESFTINDILVDDLITPTLRVQIYDTPTVDEDTGTLIVPVKPVNGDLVPAPDSRKWDDIEENTVLINQTSGNDEEVSVTEVIGSGATGLIQTTRGGSISSAEITRGGSGYTTIPYVTVGSTTASTLNLNSLDLEAQTFLTQLTVASTADGYVNPVGVGYGIQVSEGKIYQKGYFLNVDAQFAFVDKYSNTPSDVAVGFTTLEGVVNVFTDATLYDNSNDFTNFSAPGANRLQLTPQLSVKSIAEQEADAEFFSLVKFSEGRPYAQFKTTQYNKINDMIARRTYEESGNYALDQFKLTIRSTSDIANSDTHFIYVIDPGHAYINGYRVKTERNYAKKVEKSKNVSVKVNQEQDLIYGSYIRVNQLAGTHVFKSGQTINLYSAQTGTDEGIKYYDNYATNTAVSAARITGNQIGTAKIRSVLLESGNHGTNDAVYRVYIFDIALDKASFRDIRSIYVPSSGGSEDGIADILLTTGSDVLRKITENGEEDVYSPSTYTRFAELFQSQTTSLVVPTGRAPVTTGEAFANTTGSGDSINYVYGTTSVNQSVSSGGDISISGLPAGNIFNYIGELTDSEEGTLIIVPEDEITVGNFASGITLVQNAGQSNSSVEVLDATVGTPLFSDNLVSGDWIKNNSGDVVQVLSVDSQDRITIRKPSGSFAFSNEPMRRVFPKNIPINLGSRTTANATVNNDRTSMTINLGAGQSISTTSVTLAVTYNVRAKNVSSTPITANRNRFVKVSSAGAFPKSLGLPGVFRLREVYNGTDTTAAKITQEFYIEDGQKDGFWGLSKLYREEGTPSTLASTILIELDHFVPSDSKGVKTVDSYTINDEVPLEGLSTDVNTLEIPYHIRTSENYEVLLRDCLDFRPYCDPTATSATTPAGASTDPSAVESFSAIAGYAFPIPQGDLTYDLTTYDGRTDVIALTNEGEFVFNIGTRDLNIKSNANRLQLYKIDVAPYPSLPLVLSNELREITLNGVISTRASRTKLTKYTCAIQKLDDQTQGYTMAQIAELERRIISLEYNQNLSELENETRTLSFPSSIDPTLEKFKYGFYADNFENFNRSDTQNQEFAASIYEYNLYPQKTTSVLSLEPCNPDQVTGGKIVYPSQRFRLLSQKNATYGPYIEQPPEPEIQTVCQFVRSQNTRYAQENIAPFTKAQGVWEETTFTGTNRNDGTARNIDIKFYIPSSGVAGIGFEVLQTSTPPRSGSVIEKGNVIWSSSVETAEALTGPEAFKIYQKFYDVRNGSNAPVPFQQNAWFTTISNSSKIMTNIPGSPNKTYKAYRGAGKITIPYDESKGRYITVRALKWGKVFNYEVCYPATSIVDPVYDAGSTTINTTPPCPPKGKFLYARCVGNDYVTYVEDGNCKTVVGSRQTNSSRCIIIPPAPEPDPVNPCPSSGTFNKDYCKDGLLYVYQYTGKQDSRGNCSITLASAKANPDRCPVKVVQPEPEVEVCEPEPPIIIGDDGCVIGVDPECEIEEDELGFSPSATGGVRKVIKVPIPTPVIVESPVRGPQLTFNALTNIIKTPIRIKVPDRVTTQPVSPPKPIKTPPPPPPPIEQVFIQPFITRIPTIINIPIPSIPTVFKEPEPVKKPTTGGTRFKKYDRALKLR